MTKLRHLRRARAKHAVKLAKFENVVGTGLGQKSTDGIMLDTRALIVFVHRKVSKKRLKQRAVPKFVQIKGKRIRTDVVELRGIETQFGQPPYACSDKKEIGTVSSLCRDGDLVFGATCAHCLKGPDLDPQTADAIEMRGSEANDFVWVGQSDYAVKAIGRGNPGDFGFLDAGLFTIEDKSLKKKTLNAKPMRTWQSIKTGTPVVASLPNGQILNGKIKAVEVEYANVKADVCVEVLGAGTFKGDSGLLWKTENGTAVAVHAKGSIERRGQGSKLSFCMSADRMMSALGVEFVDL